MNDSQIAKEKRKFVARLKEARIGDPTAQYDVAVMFANGVGVGKNVVEAFEWTKHAAEKGHVAAQYLLGSAYSGGLGTLKDEYMAFLWLVRAQERGSEKAAFKLSKVLAAEQPALAFKFALDAAEKGLADAQVTVAECLANGMGVESDSEASHQWLQRAAEQGHSSAQFALGQLQMVVGAESSDHAAARTWFRKAARAGHPGAQVALDRLDLDGYGRIQTGPTTKVRAGLRERRSSDTRFLKYVSHGRTDDFYHLGLLYELGHSLERSHKQAKVWFKKAAEQGDVRAQFALANSYEQSEVSKAIPWFERAAAQGHVQAQYELGERLLIGNGLDRDRLAALALLSRSSVQGSSKAQLTLAEMLNESAKDLADTLIVRAAASGEAQAQCAMGDRYRRGIGVTQNWFEATRWYQLAAEQGNAQAQCALAGCFAEGRGVKKDLAIAFLWYEKAAAQDLPQAQWNLGELYATGLPGIEADPKKATMLCKRAANAGFAPARATLAALFAKAKKHDRAFHWWSLAADQGDIEAQFNIAQAYRLGLGVDKDEKKAFAWLLKAAQGGVAAAQSRIGLAYATGEGAALDSIESAKWFQLAAIAGEASAKANFERAKRIIGPAQQAEADRRAQEWIFARENKA
jgi:TPR repeat protein